MFLVAAAEHTFSNSTLFGTVFCQPSPFAHQFFILNKLVKKVEMQHLVNLVSFSLITVSSIAGFVTHSLHLTT